MLLNVIVLLQLAGLSTRHSYQCVSSQTCRSQSVWILPLLPGVLPRQEDRFVEYFWQRVDSPNSMYIVDLNMEIPIGILIQPVKMQYDQILFPGCLLDFLLLRLVRCGSVGDGVGVAHCLLITHRFL